MSSPLEKKIELQNILVESASKISQLCSELSTEIRQTSNSSQLNSKVDQVFKSFLNWNREIANQINTLFETQISLEKQVSILNEEKKKLEVLYSSGIIFSSKQEKKSLIESALDIVVKELKADAGFITLINERDEIDSIYSKNMLLNDNPDAMEISTTVIRNTLKSHSPVQVDNLDDQHDYAKQVSILKLGITSALCVPLISGNKVLGAVYLDKRNNENSFSNNDLMYLISFANLIVKGLEISTQIDSLEKKMISDPLIKLDDLRKEFISSEIIGRSKKLFDVLKVASKVAVTDASLIILGESGSGKNLLAQAIHRNSRRKDHPFYTVDCSSIPTDLLESELFGYESGAFTGATKTKVGKLELAHGGTLFLDEVGEMNINLQPKLLRVIQTKEFERLGGIQPIKIDVRIIAATNKNINELIQANKFREDLYYRLKVIEITMPKLRERKEDIADLVNYYLHKNSTVEKLFTISEKSLEVLENYNWPGNIRELEHVLLRCIVLSKSSEIDVDDLPPEIVQQFTEELPMNDGMTLSEAETEFRKRFILKVLRRAESKTEAAKLLGINRTHFHKLLSQLEIDV
ncbi:MAG: sigma-54-dependent Fis family transcriptional regulator [Ignavibacteria bacterium]|jgi:transcriptional regulator with GAF, ATPase, and Fis domain|nr:sigma-54-dependent Fis family transcriptional regulator [Ignavibacteria bacterium]